MKSLYHPLLVVLIMAGLWSSCTREEIGPATPGATLLPKDVALEWNKLFLEVERFTPGYRPPVSARTSGYIGLTAYEAIVHGMHQSYNSFSGVFEGLVLPEPDPNETYDWEVSLNAAYEAAFYYYFPVAPAAQQFRILETADRLKKKLEARTSPEIFNRSVDFGQEIARAIYEWSKTDQWGDAGFLKNQDQYYIPPNGDGLWQPTYPDFSGALLPYWGRVRTFAATDADRVAPPLEFSHDHDSPLYLQAKETWDLVNRIKNGENQEDRWIADFWSDDCPILTFTPAGRWIAVTNQVIENENPSLDYAVYTYAKVGMALCDAGIKCWGEKYRYNCLRPIDFIRTVMKDANWNTIMCPDGSGNFYTPNFPAYPSGHATFGAAAAEVLTSLYGSNYAMTDRSHETRTEFIGKPRSYQNFYEMAEENGYSRIPIGVHFRMDSEAGLDLGYKVGRRVNSLPWQN